MQNVGAGARVRRHGGDMFLYEGMKTLNGASGTEPGTDRAYVCMYDGIRRRMAVGLGTRTLLRSGSFIVHRPCGGGSRRRTQIARGVDHDEQMGEVGGR